MFSKNKPKKPQKTLEDQCKENLLAVGVDPDKTDLDEYFNDGNQPKGSLITALEKFNKYIQEDLEFSQSEGLLETVNENLDELSVQKILDSPDDRFLLVYSLIERILRKATYLDLRYLIDDFLRANICNINVIDDLISSVVDEIYQERLTKDEDELRFRITLLIKDLSQDLSDLLNPE